MSERNAAQALDIISELEKKGLKASEEVRNERYNICLACDKLYGLTKTCKVCGCFMQVKTYMPEQSCPLGKWGAVSKTETKS